MNRVTAAALVAACPLSFLGAFVSTIAATLATNVNDQVLFLSLAVACSLFFAREVRPI